MSKHARMGRTFDPAAPLPLPPCDHESQTWRVTNPELFSRSEVRAQNGSYDSAIPADISTWTQPLPADLAADLGDAEQALTTFDTYAARLLGTSDATVGPMSAILLRTESASSSQIEQLTVSAKQIALAEIRQSRSKNAQTVLGNVRAMEAALQLADDVNDEAIRTMHRELLQRQHGSEAHAGEYRDQVVWIGRGGAGPRTAEFVAPQPGRIRHSMNDLLAFVQRDDLPILLQVAIAHAQFETIHPFVDGNGRTGRALSHALLRNKGLVTRTTVPISAGLLVDTGRYFDALTAYRNGDARPIIETFAQASRRAASTGTVLVDRLAAEVDHSRGLLAGVRSDSGAWTVLPHLVGQPIINTKHLKDEFSMSDAVANRTLATLTERGILRETTGNRRNRVWQQTNVLQILDDYAANLRRPTPA